jgi:hypothetical protein
MHPYYETLPHVSIENHAQTGFWGGLAAALAWMAASKMWNGVVRDGLKVRELNLRTAWPLFGLTFLIASIWSHDSDIVWQNRLNEANRRTRDAERRAQSRNLTTRAS